MTLAVIHLPYDHVQYLRVGVLPLTPTLCHKQIPTLSLLSLVLFKKQNSPPDQATSPSLSHSNNNIGAYAPASAGIDGSNHFHDTYSPAETAPVAILSDAPGSSAAVFAQSGMPLSHMPQSNRTIRTERMMQAAQAMAGAQNVNPQHAVNPLSHPVMPMQQQPNVPERGIGRHVSAPSGLSLPGHDNNLAANIHYPDSFHQTFSNLPHSVYPSTNEFEPRPIDPNLNNKFNDAASQYSEYNDSWEPERVAPLPPRKPPSKGSTEGRPKGLEREASEKSLKVDSIFGGGSKKYQDYQGSSAHLSAMSLSIGDMHSQVSETTNPDDLAPLFNTSLRVGGRRDATSRLNTSVSTGLHSSLGHVMDMSVATLGDRLSDFGEASIQRLTESTADMSFSNVFEDKER